MSRAASIRSDAETIETELMIADLESLERRTEQTRKRAAAKDKESLTVLPMMEASLKLLQDGKPVRTMLKSLAAEDLAILHGLNLLTSHPVLYVCNVSEEDAATGNATHGSRGKDGCRTGRRKHRHFRGHRIRGRAAARRGSQRIPLGPRPRRGGPRPAYPRRLPASRPDHLFHRRPQGNPRLDHRAGTKAPAAAGVIHTDFERGFIRAFTIAYDDYVALGGEVPAKEAGKARDEGKEYVVQDGDVIHFRFNT
jgi:ribosome-binding ATPase YchF (GTP1/OBG family)